MTALPRLLTSEILDHLDEQDPDAMRSRRDLQRINRIMGSAGTLLKALNSSCPAPARILEIGAGDGSLMLRLANRLASTGKPVELTLLDRQQLVDVPTRHAFQQLGWKLETVQADVLEWANAPSSRHWDLCLANLFIHHFDAAAICRLFQAIARRCDVFIACEPRRSGMALAASRLVGLIGANAVTRQDAVASVHAGFTGAELSALWPSGEEKWQVDERPAGLFSHRFVAMRTQQEDR